MRVRMSVDPESGMADLPEAPVEQPSQELPTDLARRTAAHARLTEVCNKALQGTLPRDHEPAPNMPERLCAAAISAVIDYGHGSTPLELSEKYDYHLDYARKLMRHPDAITILSYIHGAQADKMTDMLSRIEHLAPEALTVKVGLMRTAGLESLKDKIASDILSMAGYGERKKVEVAHKHTISMPAQAATGIASALDEANQVASLDYSAFIAPSAGTNVEDRIRQLGAGHTEVGSLPTNLTAEANEREDHLVDAQLRIA